MKEFRFGASKTVVRTVEYTMSCHILLDDEKNHINHISFQTMVLRYLLLSGLIFGGVWAACFVNKDCGKCIQDKESFFDVFGCRWCPLTRSCHAFGSGIVKLP